MTRLSRLRLLGLALVALGCASPASKFQAPEITLVKASMVSADVFNQQFRVRLHVQNPNDRELPVKSISYRLFLEGDSFADGESLAPFVVPAKGEQEFDLNVRTQFSSSVGRLLSRLTGTNRTSIDYAFTGAVVLDLPFSPKLPFSTIGSVDLARR